MRTIIQSFPTIYGEAVNGSVLGQPNGSIARPPQNAAASITLSGTVKLTYVRDWLATSALYTLGGLSIDYNIPSGFAVCKFEVTNASDETVASATWTEEVSDVGNLLGPVAKKPTDGDSLTLTATATDSDGNTIATSTLSITAEVPA